MILHKLYQAYQTNDSTYIPGTSNENRSKVYHILWRELIQLAQRSKSFHKGKSTELYDLVMKILQSSTSQESTDVVMTEGSSRTPPNDSPLQSTQKIPSPTATGNRPQNRPNPNINSGDLTHSGSTLEQEKKRRKFSHFNDPFEGVDNDSLFSTFWHGKLKNHTTKNVL